MLRLPTLPQKSDLDIYFMYPFIEFENQFQSKCTNKLIKLKTFVNVAPTKIAITYISYRQTTFSQEKESKIETIFLRHNHTMTSQHPNITRHE